MANDQGGDRRRGQLRQLARPGRRYYHDADPADVVPGLMHVELAGYHVRDLEFVAAFDVDAEKVGTDLSKAIFSSRTTRSASPTSATSA